MYRTLNVNNSNFPKTRRLSIDKFFGVDFTSGETLTDIRRSHDAKKFSVGR